MKKLVLSCLIATSSTLLTDAFADLAPIRVPACASPADCLPAINGNVYTNGDQLNIIKKYLAGILGVAQDGNKAEDDSNPLSPLNPDSIAVEYNSAKMYIINSPLAVNDSSSSSGSSDSGSSSTIPSFALSGTGSDFGKAINTIQSDIDTSNYFSTQNNNGFNPIEYLDSQPYSFPRSNQIIVDSLASQPVSE